MKSIDDLLKPLVSCHNIDHPSDWDMQFGRKAPLDVEIGFGMGEFLVRSAKNSPGRNFIGFEQIWERIFKTLKRIKREERLLDNIKILKMDVRVSFERLFDQKRIDNVYCLFPCPWPKKGHIKHRLFSTEFLKLVNSRLKEKGFLKIVTDFYPYYEWVLEQSQDTGFDVTENTVQPQYDTKFERKWMDAGQKEFYEINMRKVRHVDLPVRRDVKLKTYKVQDFDPLNFKFQDQIGKCSIVFKEMIFDEKKQKGVVYLIVSEMEMMQYFWVSIIRKDTGWRICKTEGQNFFPTVGIAKALELVYQSATSSTKKA
ncbi:MAG: tRNA (guanosine(46)-N7)-methyltransferase TrmB [Candidatus Omnitrophica bacterium]|nr:tRNA (guanosine(46)-N7)-methyltransferase TrmB [Candidatus Omnitrophota bacterium]MBU1997738.1 tRNA (guanosine(46)-N7)-methyltransferase TrmB [Candidatus Omnitrophota bacterium]MBU4333651.1 tRNA (guanosine(46)-N7)-methyltransferase TrmB [Candidatus Omnitrophota bacterium]